MKKLFLLFLILITSAINAQTSNIKVTGTVLDSKGLSIPGATVTSAESSTTTTDFDGKYVIAVKSSKATLKFTFIGFKTQIIEVGSKRVIDVKLIEEFSALDEVVVVGYGTQKRSSVTGSVAKVKSDKIENAPVSRLDNALQGKIAGVTIQNISSEAGADTQVSIRGVSSIGAGTGPLVVVDGQPMPDGFGALNTADVESVEVLKDAASAAIYGSRGANGVILISTKSGKDGKTKFTFKNTVGVKSAYETYDILSSTDYVTRLYAEDALRKADPLWTTLAPYNYGATTGSISKFMAQYIIEKDILGGQATNYQDEVLRNASYQDIQFNVAGGSKKNKFFISTGYQNDQGLMLRSEFKKLNFRVKYDSQISDKVKLSINLNPSNTKTERPGTNYIDFTRFPSLIPIYHTQASADFINNNAGGAGRNIKAGDWGEDDDFANLAYSGFTPGVPGVPSVAYSTNSATPFTTSNNNPMRALLLQHDNNNQFRFQGSLALDYDITKDFSFRTAQSIYYRDSRRLETGATNAVKIPTTNFATYTNNNYFDFLTENTFNYKKTIGNHDFSALAGFTMQSTRQQLLTTTGTGFPSDQIQNLLFATQVSIMNQYDYTVGLLSALGRVNYSYKDKYLFMASYRQDGSSLFADGYKWGGFPAASVGWVVSKENFLKNVYAINRLALRASYGATGNNNIPQFLYENNFNNANYVYTKADGTTDILGGLANTSDTNFNKDITWERTFQTNLGFDLSMFRNRVSLNIDVYDSNTEKLLLTQSAPLITGSYKTITNAGSLNNRGIEVEFSTTNIKTKDFTWKTDFNISHTKNKIKDLGGKSQLLSATIDGRNGLNTYAIVGQPLVTFYGYKTDGVWISQKDIADSGLDLVKSTAGYIKEGGLKIVDTNNDKIIDVKDQTILGNPYPDFTWGFSNKFNYKNIDLSFTLQGVQGGKLLNGDINYAEPKERNLNYMANRWVSPNNPGDGKTPYLNNGINWLFTDNAIEDASYVSLREVSFGYNLGQEALNSIGLTSLRFSLSAQNLLFFANKSYRGINIEARTNKATDPLIEGYQRGAFPMQRTVLAGVEIGL